MSESELEIVGHAFGAAQRVSGWRPIETAPKDGRAVDLWNKDGRAADCRWGKYYRTTKESPRKALWFDGWVQWDDRFEDWLEINHDNPEEITHWMPIPAGPSGESS